MKILNRTLVLVAATVSLVASAFAMDPNSFLREPAATKSALVGQVKRDPIVMGRYMRHFGMTKPQVVTMLSSLHLSGLKEDGVYLVYNTPAWGEIKARALFFKKGMAVWADPQGNVVLKESCGNPMVRGTDSVSVTVDAPVTGTNVLRPLDVVPTAEPTMAPLLANNLPVVLDSAPQTFSSIAPSIPSLVSSGGFNPVFLVPVVLVPFIKTSTNNPPPSSVPEPTALVALALGAGFFVARRGPKK